MDNIRLDSRSKDEFKDSIEKWEEEEDKYISIFANKYINKYGGDVEIKDLGFRHEGIEDDIENVDSKPDFELNCSEGPLSTRPIEVEVQAMGPDYNEFHVKKHKVENSVNDGSYILHVSGTNSDDARMSFISPEDVNDLSSRSKDRWGIVGFPNTQCNRFPNGKPAIRLKDDWIDWYSIDSSEGSDFEEMLDHD